MQSARKEWSRATHGKSTAFGRGVFQCCYDTNDHKYTLTPQKCERCVCDGGNYTLNMTGVQSADWPKNIFGTTRFGRVFSVCVFMCTYRIYMLSLLLACVCNFVLPTQLNQCLSPDRVWSVATVWGSAYVIFFFQSWSTEKKLMSFQGDQPAHNQNSLSMFWDQNESELRSFFRLIKDERFAHPKLHGKVLRTHKAFHKGETLCRGDKGNISKIQRPGNVLGKLSTF